MAYGSTIIVNLPAGPLALHAAGSQRGNCLKPVCGREALAKIWQPLACLEYRSTNINKKDFELTQVRCLQQVFANIDRWVHLNACYGLLSWGWSPPRTTPQHGRRGWRLESSKIATPKASKHSRNRRKERERERERERATSWVLMVFVR